MKKLFDEIPYLEGERVVLRKIVEEDRETLWEMAHNSIIYRYEPTYLLEQQCSDVDELFRDLYPITVAWNSNPNYNATITNGVCIYTVSDSDLELDNNTGAVFSLKKSSTAQIRRNPSPKPSRNTLLSERSFSICLFFRAHFISASPRSEAIHLLSAAI